MPPKPRRHQNAPPKQEKQTHRETLPPPPPSTPQENLTRSKNVSQNKTNPSIPRKPLSARKYSLFQENRSYSETTLPNQDKPPTEGTRNPPGGQIPPLREKPSNTPRFKNTPLKSRKHLSISPEASTILKRFSCYES